MRNTNPIDKKVKEIEAAAINGLVKPFLDDRGIDYEVSLEKSDIHLNVHIKDNIWMTRPVKMEEVDRLLEIIPYLVARPKCVLFDGHGFSITKQ